MIMNKTETLPRAEYPEQEGVSSKKLSEFFEKLDETYYHGFMVIKNGKVVAERYRTPYNCVDNHELYSVSKSITAIAVGFAVCEGLLSLDQRIVDIFPEYKVKKNDGIFNKMTVEHLITLTSGVTSNPGINKSRHKDWVKLFFHSHRSYIPGNGFEYNNENFYMACAVIRRVTGETVTDFLYPRLFEPLGIEKPFWECCPKGTESGGWGLFLSMESLAKIAMCFLDGGRYNGKQIIPEKWVEEALKSHKNQKYGQDFDDYGYGIWKRKNKNSFRFEGVFSQIAEFYPDHNALCVFVAGDCRGECVSLTANAFPELFEEECFRINEEYFSKISSKKGKEIFLPFEKSERYENEKNIENRIIRFRPHILNNILGLPLSVMPFSTVFMTKDRAGNINGCRLNFKDDCCVFSWNEGDESNSILCGLDGEYKVSKMKLASKKYNVYSSALWQDENTLKIMIRPIESIDTRFLVFTFNGDKVKMKPTSEVTIENTVYSIKWFIKSLVKSEKIAEKICKILCNCFEPIHKGKLKK